jgi:uncharacterized protein (DUF2062 family)
MTALFTSQARKAWVGALISGLAPLSVLLLATAEPLTLRSVLASVVSGIIGGLSVYNTPNAKAPAITARARRRRRYQAEENSSGEDY